MKTNTTNSLINFIMILLITVVLISCGQTVKGTPKLVDLGSDRCIPCKEMAPILDELKKDYAGVLDVEFIDVWKPENQEAATKYGIEKIPTQIFFDAKGNELWRHVGVISKEDILTKWKEFGYDLKPVNNEVIMDECSDCSDVDEQSGGCTCK